MFKKMNLKTLLIILVVVLGVYLILDYTGDNERNFKSQLTSFDKDDVTRIEYYKKGDYENSIIITRKNNGWFVDKDNNEYPADSNRVKRMIDLLHNLKVDRVEAKNKERWKKYKVSDSLSTRVKMYAGEELLTDIHLGKFSFSQPPKQQKMQQQRRRSRQNMTTFVRLAGEQPVYGVKGLLSMSFPENVGQLRDKTIVEAKGSINRIKFSGKYNYALNSTSGRWMVDSQPADSATAASYVNILKSVKGSAFADVQESALGKPAQTAVIERTNDESITIKAYEAPSNINSDYIINSTANSEAWFTDKRNLFSRIFKERAHFLKDK